MLTIIASPVVDPERLDEVKDAMLDLVRETRREDGCVRYELHQDNDEPNRFTFLEIWETRELWQRHMNGPAIKKFNERIAGGIMGLELQEMTQLEAIDGQ